MKRTIKLDSIVAKSKNAVNRADNTLHRKLISSYRPISLFKITFENVRELVSSNYFFAGLLRNLVSLRVLFFIFIPVVYFHLKTIALIDISQLLEFIRQYLKAENASNYILYLGAFIFIFTISWVTDMLASAFIIHTKAQQLQHRKILFRKSFSLSLSLQDSILIVRLTNALIVSLLLVISALTVGGLIYLVVNAYISLLLAILIIIVLFVISILIHEFFRFGRNVLIVFTSLSNSIKHIFKIFFSHPFKSFAASCVWVSGLMITSMVSLGADFAIIIWLKKINIFWISILILALFTTTIILVWSFWTIWSNSFWTSYFYNQILIHKLKVVSKKIEFSLWPLIIVLSVVMIIIGGYLLIAYNNVNIIIDVLQRSYDFIPSNLNPILPKPN